MHPHTAGKIASNGPCRTVKDLYKINGLTEHDVEMLKKYEGHFIAKSASGRTFDDRMRHQDRFAF